MNSIQRKDIRGKVHFLESDKRYACNKAVFSNGYCTRSWRLVTCKNCLRNIKDGSKVKCLMWREDNKCHSDYGNSIKCDGINTPDKCPYNSKYKRGCFAMALHDQRNTRK